MKTALTYQKAYKELLDIVAEIEQETIDLDQLTEKMKRANVLLAFCREKLRDAEAAVDEVKRNIN